MKNGEVCGTSGVEGVFMEKMQEEELPPSFGNVYEAPPRDLSWRQILEQRHDTLERLRYFDEDISNTETVPPAHHRPEKIPEHIKNLVNKRAVYQGKLLQLDAELQMRPALAAGCLCFMLVGCPVGIWCSRSDYLSAFITGFLPVVFVYYPLLLAGVNLAKEGRFIPDACIWAADGLMGLVGIVLFWRLLKN
jgi:lipopolysaccharide export LptBFGC system permease protein LptF